ncbi:MAG TPA: hypothetical protein VMB05_12095 [Solirubrobacteraceae bacterium]|nr:hypothetical protein [Solirubrobacteraceae bacterium]
MKRLAHTTIFALAAAGGLLGSLAGTAAADGTATDGSYTIGLSAPSSAIVGQPVVVQATGISPPLGEIGTISWIQGAAIPAGVIGACPADAQSGVQVAASGAGVLLAIAMRPNVDTTGSFTNTLSWTPGISGQWLVCGYQSDGEGLTLARAYATVNVQPPATPVQAPPSSAPGTSQPGAAPPGAGSAPVAKPANVERPHILRSGHKLMCKPGKWSNNTASYTYSWLVNGKPKRGATAAVLRVTHAPHGVRVQCQVMTSGPGGNAGALSLPVRLR